MGGPRRYTMEQVKEHNKRENCCMVLNGHVFDITEYIPFHPGGDQILKAKGGDGTELFLKFHRWVNIEAVLKNCWIGQVANHKPPTIKKKKEIKKDGNPNDKNRKKAISRTQKLLKAKQEKEETSSN